MHSTFIRSMKAIALGVALPAVVVAFVAFQARGRIASLESRLAESEKDEARLEKILAEVRRFEAMKAHLQRKIEFINELARVRPCVARLVPAMLPARSEAAVRVQEISIRTGKARLTGKAPTGEAVRRWLDRIADEAEFEIEGEPKIFPDGKGVRFEVSGGLPKFDCNEADERLRS